MQHKKIGVVRVLGRGEPLQQALNSEGADSTLLPVMEIVPKPISASDRQVLLDLDQFQHVIVASPSAANVALDFLEGYWPQWPVQQTWWAVGTGTAAELEKRALTPYIPELHTSEGLLSIFDSEPEDRVLLLTGEGGRTKLIEVLTERDCRVQEVELYKRQPLEVSDLAPWMAQDALLVASGELLECLYSFAERDKLTSKLLTIPLIVPSERVQVIAQRLGFDRVVNSGGMKDKQLIKATKDLFR